MLCSAHQWTHICQLVHLLSANVEHWRKQRAKDAIGKTQRQELMAVIILHIISIMFPSSQNAKLDLHPGQAVFPDGHKRRDAILTIIE